MGIHSLRERVDRARGDGADADADTVDLRILATTDLHAQLTARDYVTGRRRPDVGLTRVATLIRAARAEAANTLLFDNGDAIEGSAIADHAVATGRGAAHPLIAAMNALAYDAATLGNHEFSHGLAFLQAAVGAAAHPVVSANLAWADGRGPFVAPSVILNRRLQDRGGRPRAFRIGVFGLTPPQVLVWEAKHIAGRLTARDMVEAGRAAAAALRAQGADLVVALCHAGLTAVEADHDNPGLSLAADTGADALVLGHGHQVFPGPDFAGLPGVDLAQGTVCARPVAMPGSHGSHLGVVDLALRPDGGRWRVASARASVRPVHAAVAEDAGLLAAARPVERRLARWLSQPAGRTAVPLNSYFAVVADGPLLQTIAAAKAVRLAAAAPGTALAGLPVLAAVAPFRAGGRGGPLNYVDLPPGPLTRRALTELYVHPNSFSAVAVSGADLADWLERGVSGYVRQDPAAARPAELVDPAFPSFAFEPIYGLSYRIDLTAPRRFDAQGRLTDPAARRIRDLTWAGRPVTPDMRFAVATNSYRASLLCQQMGDAVLARIDQPVLSREVLGDWLGATDPPRVLAPGGWAFLPVGGPGVLFDTGPGALPHLPRIAPLRPQVRGRTPAGFLRLHLAL